MREPRKNKPLLTRLTVATQRQHIVLLPSGAATRALRLVVAVALAGAAVLAASRRQAALCTRETNK